MRHSPISHAIHRTPTGGAVLYGLGRKAIRYGHAAPSLPCRHPLPPCRGSTCELPTGLRQHLEEVGVPDAAVREFRDSVDFVMNAEGALVTLAELSSRQRVQTLLTGHPELLCVPLGTWLDFLTAYGVSRRDFFKLLSTNPRIFTLGSLFNAGNVIAFLQSLGISPRDVSATVIPRCSGLLLLDCHTRLAPAAAFLQEELGLDRTGVRDLLCRCPALLSMDADAELAPRVETLRAAGFSRDEVRRLLLVNSALLIGDPTSSLQLRLAFLTAECGFSPAQALAVLRSCPEVMALSVPNLSRKWRFLTQRMRGGTNQVLEYPQFWSKSLLLDIGPRFAYVTDRRLLLPAPSMPSEPAAAVVVADGATTAAPARGSGGAASAGAGSGLDLSLLLAGDDVVFMERIWRASGGASPVAGAGGATGAGAGAAPDSGGGSGVDPEDYERYRSAWLETEGVKWSGVNAVGANAVGSW